MDTEPIVTTDVILDTMKGWVEDKHPISPSLWMDAAMKLNMFLGDERAKLYILKQEVSRLKVMYHEAGDNGVVAKAKVEASDLYKEMLTQQGRIEQIIELGRLAKQNARLTNEEIKGYN